MKGRVNDSHMEDVSNSYYCILYLIVICFRAHAVMMPGECWNPKIWGIERPCSPLSDPRGRDLRIRCISITTSEGSRVTLSELHVPRVIEVAELRG